MYVNSTLQKFHGCKMTKKMAKNIDQMIKDSPHRSMKKIQLFMGERYPLHIYCHGTENLWYSFEN